MPYGLNPTTNIPGGGGNSGGNANQPGWANFSQTPMQTPYWARANQVSAPSWSSIAADPDMQNRANRARTDAMTGASTAADQFRRSHGGEAASAANDAMMQLMGAAQSSRAGDDMVNAERGFQTDIGFKNAANDLQAQLANLSGSLQYGQNQTARDALSLQNITSQAENALGNRNASINQQLGMGRLGLDRDLGMGQLDLSRLQALMGNDLSWAQLNSQNELDWAGLNQNNYQFNQTQQLTELQGLMDGLAQAGYNPAAYFPIILQMLGGFNAGGYSTPGNLGELAAQLNPTNQNVNAQNAANQNNSNNDFMQQLMDMFTQMMSGMGGGSGGAGGGGNSGSGSGSGGFGGGSGGGGGYGYTTWNH